MKTNDIATPENLHAVYFAGGSGKRLLDVTGGAIPKAFVLLDEKWRAFDVHKIAFEQSQIQNVTIATQEKFQELFQGEIEKITKPSWRLRLDSRPGAGTYPALLDIAKEVNASALVVTAQDNLFHPQDLKKLVDHRDTNIVVNWLMTGDVEGMESYQGIAVENVTGTVRGDSKKHIPPLDAINTTELTRTNLAILQREGLLALHDEFNAYVEAHGPHEKGQIDVFWDLFPFLLRKSIMEKRALLHAVIADFPVVDFGRPARLETARQIFRDAYHSLLNL